MKALFLLVILLASNYTHADASSLAQRQSDLYPYSSALEIQDDFMYGINSTGNVGTGWGFAGGTGVWINAEPNRPGLFRRSSGVVINTVTRLDWETVISAIFDPAAPHALMLAVRMVQTDAGTSMRLGSMSGSAANPPIDAIYLEKLGPDTNWFCVTRSGGVQTRTDSGIAVDTNFHEFGYIRNSSGVQFVVDSVNVCGVHTTNIPTNGLGVALQLINLVGVSKSYDIDYAQLRMSLAR